MSDRRHEGGHRLLSLRREADPSLVMTDTSGRPITNERVNEWRATVEPEIEVRLPPASRGRLAHTTNLTVTMASVDGSAIRRVAWPEKVDCR